MLSLQMPETELRQPEVRTQILGALEKWQELVQRWAAAPAPVAVAQAGRGDRFLERGEGGRNSLGRGGTCTGL